MGEGRGEGDAMNPLLTDEERAFAKRHRIAHLATADAGGAPHVIPICYALVDDAFYFVVDDKPKRSRSLKRLRNIAENPQVALVVDDYDEDWTRLAYLLVHGRAALVENPQEYATALARLQERYSQYHSMALAFDTHPMVRILPQRRRLWRAATG